MLDEAKEGTTDLKYMTYSRVAEQSGRDGRGGQVFNFKFINQTL